MFLHSICAAVLYPDEGAEQSAERMAAGSLLFLLWICGLENTVAATATVIFFCLALTLPGREGSSNPLSEKQRNCSKKN